MTTSSIAFHSHPSSKTRLVPSLLWSVVLWMSPPSLSTFLHAQDARLTLELEAPYNDVVQLGILPLALKITNYGNVPVPCGLPLLSSTYHGASLTIVVKQVEEESPSFEFLFEPSASTLDEIAVSALQPGTTFAASAGLGATIKAEVGASGKTERTFVPAFPRAGVFSVHAVYRHQAKETLSNELRITVTAPPDVSRYLGGYIETMGEDAVFLYEPQLMPLVLKPEQLEKLTALATEFSNDLYGDYADYAIACYYSRQSLYASAYPDRFGAALQLARESFGKIDSDVFLSHDEVRRLGGSLGSKR